MQLLQEIGTPREEAPVAPGRPPAKGTPAASPPGMVDLSGLTLGPCPLVPADQAAGAQVVQLHLHSAEPLPDTLQAAAAVAGASAIANQIVPRASTQSILSILADLILHATLYAA